jgi:hypothetical protein
MRGDDQEDDIAAFRRAARVIRIVQAGVARIRIIVVPNVSARGA